MSTNDHPTGSVRLFVNRHGDEHEQARAVFPDGIVKVVHLGTDHSDGVCVEYIEAVEGRTERRFYAQPFELSAISAVTLRPEDTWVIEVPGLPMFYLNGAVQGIRSKVDAARVAALIIGEQASVGPSNITRLAD